MANRDSSGVERRRARLDGNRPRTHPKRSGRKVTKSQLLSPDTCESREDADVLERLSRAVALVETIAVAMQTREDDIELGPIAASLQLACCQLRQSHGAVELALRGVTS